MPLTIGVDVGGTKIAAGVVDDDGHILAQLRRETPSSNSAATVDAVAGLAAELALAHEVEGIGIGAPGFIDETRSIVRFAPNLAWREEPLGEAVHKRTQFARCRGERRQLCSLGGGTVSGRLATTAM